MQFLAKNNPPTIAQHAFSGERGIALFFERAVSLLAIAIIVLAIISLLSFYIYIGFQPYRGPTKLYFFGFLIAAIISPRVAVFSLIALLPLLPNLHSQLELIVKPAVKYFVAFPAIDASVGLFLGEWVGRCLRAKRLEKPFSMPPWPLSLLLIVISVSCSIAIGRNLWQTASIFSFKDLSVSILNFKILSRTNDYHPISDWITFSILCLLIVVLSEVFKREAYKLDGVLKPLVIGIAVSALWGIFQSLTGFGLVGHTLRPYRFSFGAVGFQPDIHAYGGLMSFGAVGLLALMSQPITRAWKYALHATIFLSWCALVQSQSRASIAIAFVFLLALVILNYIYKKNISKASRISFYLALIGVSACLLGGAVFAGYQFISNKFLFTYDALNLISSWRLDLFLGAIRMWWHLPFMGVGQGNFLRVGPEYDVSGSALMAMTGGENAHNYFLQMIAELGLIGFFCVVILFVWPSVRLIDKKVVGPIWIAVTALFIGNAYSHSFVIRENLFILGIFIALLYALATTSVSRIRDNYPFILKNNFRSASLLLLVPVIISFAVLEVNSSLERTPFEFASNCYGRSVSEQWKGGRAFVEVPPGAVSVSVSLRAQSEVNSDSTLPIDSKFFDRLSTRAYHGETIVSEQDKNRFTVKFSLPSDEIVGSNGGVIILSMKGCLRSSDLNIISSLREIDLKIIN